THEVYLIDETDAHSVAAFGATSTFRSRSWDRRGRPRRSRWSDLFAGLTDSRQPGVTGELPRRWLRDERPTKAVRDLRLGRWYPRQRLPRLQNRPVGPTRFDVWGPARCRSPRWASRLGGPPMSEVTRVLSAVEAGDPSAAAELLPLVYDELRKLAAARLAD